MITSAPKILTLPAAAARRRAAFRDSRSLFRPLPGEDASAVSTSAGRDHQKIRIVVADHRDRSTSPRSLRKPATDSSRKDRVRCDSSIHPTDRFDRFLGIDNPVAIQVIPSKASQLHGLVDLLVFDLDRLDRGRDLRRAWQRVLALVRVF